eukprot:2947033-Pyramimonas_sp.AAC.1
MNKSTEEVVESPSGDGKLQYRTHPQDGSSGRKTGRVDDVDNDAIGTRAATECASRDEVMTRPCII